jgi:hypothetical protein
VIERRAGIGSARSIPCPRIDYVFSGFHGPTGAGRSVLHLTVCSL